MARRSTQRDFRHTWYIREWMDTLGVRQRDLIQKLDWSRAKAHALYHGQQYTQELIDDLVTVLPGVQPFELLMHPREAMALRQMRAAAFTIAADNEPKAEARAEPAPFVPRKASNS